MKRIKRTSDIVKDVLTNCPHTRNSDDLLYIQVCRKLNPMICTQSFQTVMLYRSQLGLPPFESVRRARQKIQAAFPELCGSDEVEAMRVVNEQTVYDYSRSVIV